VKNIKSVVVSGKEFRFLIPWDVRVGERERKEESGSLSATFHLDPSEIEAGGGRHLLKISSWSDTRKEKKREFSHGEGKRVKGETGAQ